MINFECGCSYQTLRQHDGATAPVYIDCPAHRTDNRRTRRTAHALASGPFTFGYAITQALTALSAAEAISTGLRAFGPADGAV